MIIICEPQCVGFEHADFNASLIYVAYRAFPDDKILFLGEKEHLSCIQNLLKKYKLNICEYQEIIVPERFDRESKRFLTEFKLVRNVFKLAKKSGSEKVIFSSITSPTLVSIKIWLFTFKNIKTVVILHSILETIAKYPHISRDFVFWLKIWLSVLNSNRLQYIVLGKPIEKELLHEIPNIKTHVSSLNLPFFFKNDQIKHLSNDKIKFGFLGIGIVRKGINDFFSLAEYIKKSKEGKNSEFILIGQLMDNIEFDKDSVTINPKNLPLSQEIYDKLTKSIDYTLFFHNRDQYKFIASATFFDAISNLKPIIAIKNLFFEYYFNLMGDIGYLCDDLEEMKKLVRNISKNPPKERYIIQQQNILKGREKFNFNELASELKKAWK